MLVTAIGLCVTEVGIERFDDLDMVENVLSRVEVLRDPFLNKLNGILLCWEKRFVEGMEAGWHDDVSYRKGMIGCWYRDRDKGQAWSKCYGFGSRLDLLRSKKAGSV